jgi:hypothetical protein
MHNRNVMKAGLQWFALLLVIISGAVSAQAQGFMVKPAVLELSARRGEAIETQIEVRNATERLLKIEVISGGLGQQDSGGAKLLEPTDERSTTAARSCFPWLKLDSTELDIPPLMSGKVNLKIKVPLGVHGFYSAALRVRNKPPENLKPKELALVVQFTVPILITIQGTPARERIAPVDASMRFHPKDKDHPATTHVVLSVCNSGETFGRVHGRMTVFAMVKNAWRQVLQTDVGENVALLPGYTINIAQDIRRSLPPGKYKLQAYLTLAGRYKGRVERIVDFAGDPNVKSLIEDAALTFTPDNLEIRSTPNAMRSAVVTVTNNGVDVANVRCGLMMPKELDGVTMGTVKGTDLSCTKWATVEPREFTLQPGRRKAVRIILNHPEEETVTPNYYANLLFVATNNEGQGTGDWRVPVWVRNGRLPSTPRAQGVTIEIDELDTNKYTVTAKYANVGNIHLEPTATAGVTTFAGDGVASTTMTAEKARVLPLSMIVFSGEFNLSKVEEGNYTVTVYMKSEAKITTLELPINVVVKDEVRVVTIVDKEQLPEAAQPPADAAEAPPAEVTPPDAAEAPPAEVTPPAEADVPQPATVPEPNTTNPVAQ